jgi:RHH-type proline utilization regulon transcriptional repressor/proline dehydrogenase/delta 1-pyrroline-5-carboxylate dehydrogenase
MDQPLDAKTELAELPTQAVKLAADLLRASRENESRIDRSRSAMMARMMDDPPGKKFTIAMADQVLRMRRPQRAARRMESLIEEYGIPNYLSATDRAALWLGNKTAGLLPKMVMPFVKRQVRNDAAHVIISGEQKEFEEYLAQRKADKIRINFNQLGEAVLGDREADRRLDDYLKRLKAPGVDYCSVKLSSVVSQISLTGYQHTKNEIKKRLREIYRTAIQGGGSAGPKFVNLDMEEYRDLHLTLDIFREVLDEPEFEKLEAGIVLQAYLPDSFAALKSLTEWALDRHARTGAGIKFRLVKGANLAMEQVEASIQDWQQAPFYSKAEVDANYKRMLEYATRPEHASVIRVGVASHNLFDIAYAMLVREKRGVADRVEFEMLEGMANGQAVEVRERTGDLIVYTPVCYDDEFESAVAYLVRRLDENTAPGSFLGALFALQEGTPEWNEQRAAFLAACELAFAEDLSQTPNRKQNRLTETFHPQPAGSPFHNAADTDFSLPANRQWAEKIIADWKDKNVHPVPIQIAGEYRTDKLTGSGKDPSRPGYEAYKFAQGDKDDVETALQTAVAAQVEWENIGIQKRGEILRQIAAVFAQQRGDTIGAMLLDAGKSIMEADVEISEAIDFANYYAGSLDDERWTDGTTMKACGVVVVTPPWNFPYAIPAGGVLAALMAGNSVILKPARESVLTAWRLAEQCWQAGVPKNVLQFAPLVDGATGKVLVSDERVNAVILTGSIFTAQLFQSWRPNLRLYAETSGKNCLIISAAADPDLAIKDLVKGAFGHAGQKCSATSIALIQREVYDNPKFMNQLKDAVESLRVGGSWDAAATVTPVIRTPDEYLDRGLKQLDEGESWLVEPTMIDDNPCLWRPGVRLNVRPGSWYHTTECFGPVTGLIPFDSFEEAIQIQNSSEFGLTGGLHSLDPKEVELWREKVEVGNAYVNRTTTGAIVRRQPFGGWKDSCVGPGPKAGGPNYVATFCDWTESGLPKFRSKPHASTGALLSAFESLNLPNEQTEHLSAAAESYAHWWEKEFSIEHDPSQVHGETNHFRYRARPWHVLRINNVRDANAILSTAKVAVACRTVGCDLQISVSDKIDWATIIANGDGIELTVETEQKLVDRLKKMKGGTLRFVGEYDIHQYAPKEIGNIPIIESPVLCNGRIELLNYLKEQSVTEIVHRYGNII